jgi:hypothetical protein
MTRVERPDAFERVLIDEGAAPWVLTCAGKMWTTNGERTFHRHKRSELTRFWREAFRYLAVNTNVPNLGRVRIVARPIQHLGRLGDAAGHIPVVKAAVDGLRDAGVLEDDDGRFVVSIECLAPKRGPVESLALELWKVA